MRDYLGGLRFDLVLLAFTGSNYSSGYTKILF
jgi:hypothetical protein